MVRNTSHFLTENPYAFRLKALAWAQKYKHVHSFQDNHFPYPSGGFANFLAAGCLVKCPVKAGKTFESIYAFHQQYREWLIGYFSYDLKNEIESLSSQHPDYLHFPGAYFYIPEHLIHFNNNQITIESTSSPDALFREIESTPLPPDAIPAKSVVLESRMDKATYLQKVELIRQHIIEGDVYELNFCMEFFSNQACISPLAVYLALNARSPMPFSVFQKIGSHYLLSASPERFLKKTGNKLLSQPMKGTARRGNTPEEDTQLIDRLRKDEKELAENMMIVDLVRNDLARSAITGSVKVDELFGVYTFKQLHQMISSVSAQLKPGLPFTEAIQHAFPMGSMTGAPKIKAMELIDRYEQSRRGLFSGAVGYISPEGDFDFNVVIRSILYNANNGYLSFQVGSAITYDAQGEREYEECLLKAKAMREVLGWVNE